MARRESKVGRVFDLTRLPQDGQVADLTYSTCLCLYHCPRDHVERPRRPEQCATIIDLIAEKFDKKPFRVQQEFHQLRHQLARDRKWYLRKRAEIEARIESKNGSC